MLTDADIVQSNSGSFIGTSGSATMAATTAGNAIVLVGSATGGSTFSGATPAGFTRLTGATVLPAIYIKPVASAGETSWTLTVNISAGVAWVALEISGLDPEFPFDASQGASATNTTTGTTVAGGPGTLVSTTFDGVALALHDVRNTASGTAPTLTSPTNGFTQLGQQGAANGAVSVGLSVSALFTRQTGSFSCAVTSSLTMTGSNIGHGYILVLSAAGAKRAADVKFSYGFEWGITTGMAGGSSGFRPVESFTNLTVVTTTPRSGTYCGQLSSSAAVANFVAPAVQLITTGQGRAVVMRMCFRFATLPAADTDLLLMTTGGLGNLTVRYRSATSKLGLTLATSSEVLSDQAITAGVWLVLEVRLVCDGTAWFSDWQVDYGDGTLVVQTRSLYTAAGSAASVTCTFGWAASATATMLIDDVLISNNPGHHPLGDHKLLPMTVDATGTLTVTGSSALFSTFVNNGTLTAWNAATAEANIDEWPPTISAARDGIVQTAVSASSTTDYIRIPMTSPDWAGLGLRFRGGRVHWSGWAAAAAPAAATIMFGFIHPISAVATPAADNLSGTFGNSTTTPTWLSHNLVGLTGARIDWANTNADNLVLIVGGSGDATPDIGFDGVMCEGIFAVVTTQTIFGAASTGDIRVDALLDPASGGIITMTTTTPDGKGTDLTYEVNTTPTTVTVPASSSDLETPDAPDAPTVNWIELTPGPEGVADA